MFDDRCIPGIAIYELAQNGSENIQYQVFCFFLLCTCSQSVSYTYMSCEQNAWICICQGKCSQCELCCRSWLTLSYYYSHICTDIHSPKTQFAKFDDESVSQLPQIGKTSRVAPGQSGLYVNKSADSLRPLHRGSCTQEALTCLEKLSQPASLFAFTSSPYGHCCCAHKLVEATYAIV